MKLFARFISLTLVFVLLPGQEIVAQDCTEKPYRLTYKAEYNFLLPISGSAVRELKKDTDETWSLTNSVKSTLVTVEESSQFSWVEGLPRQTRYRLDQHSLKDKRLWLDFDWQQLMATNLSDTKYPPYKIDQQVYDPLTYQLALRADLRRQAKTLSYQVAEKNRVKTYSFEILGEEQMETPVGLLNTVKLRRIRKPDSTRESIFWLASDWNYVLIKIRQKERGNTFFIVMQEGELDGKTITGLQGS